MSLPVLSNLLLFFNLVGMYAFMAWSVPLSVKWACLQSTQTRVTQKFSLPLDFDHNSKNALRQFWHFSYYKECLHNHGYNTKGKKLAPSTVDNGTYHNSLANLTLTASSAAILTDNVLNVDYDDRLLLSQLILDNHPVTLAVYTRHEDIKSPANASLISHFPGLVSPIISASISDTTTTLTDTAGNTGLLFFTPANLPRIIFGPNLTLDFLVSWVL